MQTADNIGPGSYLQDHSFSQKKKMSVKEPFNNMIDRSGKTMNVKAEHKPPQASGMMPYYDEVMDAKKVLPRSNIYNPGPGQYEVAMGFDKIKRTMNQVKHLQNHGIEDIGIQIVKKSSNFLSKQNRFEDKTLKEKAALPGPGQYDQGRQ